MVIEIEFILQLEEQCHDRLWSCFLQFKWHCVYIRQSWKEAVRCSTLTKYWALMMLCLVNNHCCFFVFQLSGNSVNGCWPQQYSEVSEADRWTCTVFSLSDIERAKGNKNILLPVGTITHTVDN